MRYHYKANLQQCGTLIMYGRNVRKPTKTLRAARDARWYFTNKNIHQHQQILLCKILKQYVLAHLVLIDDKHDGLKGKINQSFAN